MNKNQARLWVVSFFLSVGLGCAQVHDRASLAAAELDGGTSSQSDSGYEDVSCVEACSQAQQNCRFSIPGLCDVFCDVQQPSASQLRCILGTSCSDLYKIVHNDTYLCDFEPVAKVVGVGGECRPFGGTCDSDGDCCGELSCAAESILVPGAGSFSCGVCRP